VKRLIDAMLCPLCRRSALRMLLLVGMLLSTGFIQSPAGAQSLRGFTWNDATVSGGLRFGTEDLNLGFGARGGYTLSQGIYLGGAFDYMFGDTTTRTITETGTNTMLRNEADFDAWFLMFEGGYDLGLAPRFVLRPMAGLGLSHGAVEFCSTVTGFDPECRDETDENGAFHIGAIAIYDLRPITLNGGLRIFIGDVDGLVLGASVGGSF